MQDLRGISERLEAGRKAEEFMADLANHIDVLNENTIFLARQCAAEYLDIKMKQWPEGLAWAGDPFPGHTAVINLIRNYERFILAVAHTALKNRT